MVISQWLSYPAASDRVLSMIGIEIHWAILQYVLGLPFMAFIALLIYAIKKDETWKKIALTLTKGFILVFAVGAATGTGAEFGLVLLWPNLTEAAGRYIYFPLYVEIFAFLMEVVFIYMLYYGWNRFKPWALVIVALLAFSGAWFSGTQILSVNSYMVAPTGIHPAYDPSTGQWLYNQGYPKLDLYIPNKLVPVLNITTLTKLGMSVSGATQDSVVVQMPVRIVQRLAWESWHGVKVKNSILMLVVNKTTVSHMRQDDLNQLLNTPVKTIVDKILVNTIKHEGVYTVTFESPVYLATVIHAIGAALTTSSFTVMGVYAFRLAGNIENEEYKKYAKKFLKFSAYFAVIIIALQGFVFGHEMGTAIARYNPEKLSAMEGVTTQHFSITRTFHLDKFMALLAYGSTTAHMPNYDTIDPNYCQCQAAPNPAITTCKPPILIHYLYYTKISLAILLGLYGLGVAYYVWRDKTTRLSKGLFKLGLVGIIVVQLVSYLGWAVREIGRKPWTIYGIMTPDVAHTFNPAPLWEVTLVALYFIGMLTILAYAVWRILWVPGSKEVMAK
ncbi:MAG: cytochrome ubiquinol oxidase subunit I [Desulfurococcales archaeon]|nr:cytochrome ubiquinol oxidase subunit I [Desulfurococcales archaeon]